jgi:3-hydroxyisobutyrate dehydrogenase
MYLLKAGFPLTVWNRTPARAQELVAAGAHLAASPSELAARSELVISIVSDPPALEEVLWGADGAMQSLQRGSIYMDSSTVSPDLVR